MEMYKKGRELEPGEIVTVRVSEDCHLGGRYRRDEDVFSFTVKETKPGGKPMHLPWYCEELQQEPVPEVNAPAFTPTGVDIAAPAVVKIRSALAALEPKNNEHWTRAGLPSVDEVDTLCGSIGVTRDAIHNAAPTFTRPEVA